MVQPGFLLVHILNITAAAPSAPWHKYANRLGHLPGNICWHKQWQIWSKSCQSLSSARCVILHYSDASVASSEGDNINWFSSFWKEHLSITRKEATELTPTLWRGSIPPSSFNQEPEQSVSNSPNVFGSERNLFGYGWVIACFPEMFLMNPEDLILDKKCPNNSESPFDV